MDSIFLYVFLLGIPLCAGSPTPAPARSSIEFIVLEARPAMLKIVI